MYSHHHFGGKEGGMCSPAVHMHVHEPWNGEHIHALAHKSIERMVWQGRLIPEQRCGSLKLDDTFRGTFTNWSKSAMEDVNFSKWKQSRDRALTRSYLFNDGRIKLNAIEGLRVTIVPIEVLQLLVKCEKFSLIQFRGQDTIVELLWQEDVERCEITIAYELMEEWGQTPWRSTHQQRGRTVGHWRRLQISWTAWMGREFLASPKCHWVPSAGTVQREGWRGWEWYAKSNLQ